MVCLHPKENVENTKRDALYTKEKRIRFNSRVITRNQANKGNEVTRKTPKGKNKNGEHIVQK
jgi:hypothetical protein